MVNEGAAIGIVDPDLIIPLGIVILDEPAKRLLFMQQWAHALRLSDSSKALGRADHRDGVGHNVSDIHKLSVWSDRDASGPFTTGMDFTTVFVAVLITETVLALNVGDVDKLSVWSCGNADR